MKREAFVLDRNGWVPNNPCVPVVLYPKALSAKSRETTAKDFEHMFEANGWPPQWRDSIFAYHHYHSTAHEVLGIACGSAQVVLGGPDGRDITLEAGDAVMLPAGTGHSLIRATENFLVVGAYPRGQSFDICREAPTAEQQRRIATLGAPSHEAVTDSTA